MKHTPTSRPARSGPLRAQLARPRFTPPGQRIVRSIVSVWLCMVIYVLRGMTGEPFYSIIAALQCIQPYSSNMLAEGRDRIIGTLIGAFWGSVILFAELLPSGNGFRTTILFYILLGIFAGLVIYSTVLLGISQYALFAAVVFLGIAMYHIDDANPYIHVFYRTLETIIGVGVAIAVNSFHLPRVRDRSTLFVSGIDDVLFREDREISRYTKVELNRFLQEGMKFTVSTKQTPATVREILTDVKLQLPIIAMDGAVLYDLHSMKYVRTEKIAPDLVSQISDFLHSEGIPFFVNTVRDDLLVIYFKDYRDLILDEIKDAHNISPEIAEAASSPDSDSFPVPGEHALSKSAYLSMAGLYRKKRTSPYRNYVRTNAPVTEDVVYILVIDREEKIDQLVEKIKAQPWAPRCRTNFDYFDCDEGDKILRIYAANANRPAMLKYLQKYVGAPKVMTFGSVSDQYDVVIRDAGKNQMVRELKKKFSPVDLRGWKNILHM
jgi:hydroxymethylpyrimidine pyrophosphatase-like HAD family hydrolase